ncbi:MAG: hypothetical protein O2779_05210 [Nanoarchaeota archaeon]|nr:hypothetical protein [Nanoarchaeota archaeon]
MDLYLFPLPSTKSIDSLLQEWDPTNDTWFNDKMTRVAERNVQIPAYIRKIARGGEDKKSKKNALEQGLFTYLLFERNYSGKLPIIEREWVFPKGWEWAMQWVRSFSWEAEAKDYLEFLDNRPNMHKAITDAAGKNGSTRQIHYGIYAAAKMHELLVTQLERDQQI